MEIKLDKTNIELNKVSFEDAWELKSAFMKNVDPKELHEIKSLKDKEFAMALVNLSLKVDNDKNLMKTVKDLIVNYSVKVNGNLIPDLNRSRVVESFMNEKDFQREFGAIITTMILEVASPFFENHQSLLPIVRSVVGTNKK